MKVLVTGAAGFIGYHLSEALLEQGVEVIGVDLVTDYYSVALKQSRIDRLETHEKYCFYKIDLADREKVLDVFKTHRPDYAVNLAAQAGVRYSLENPPAYTHANIDGFLSIIEACRAYPVKHLLFASTSSVYGATKAMPFHESRGTEHPLTLYAATKKANEMMAHTYAHLFNIPVTGLRFFTVYGPWGRPDMALFIFTKAILEGKPIPLFNGGDMRRDFTYISDIVTGLVKLLPLVPQPDENWDAKNPDPSISGLAPYRIINIGRGKTEPLMRYVSVLEEKLGKKAKINSLPMQDGDVPATSADTTRLTKLTGFTPLVDIEEGVGNFVDWYRDYYQV